jgi:hypothetical protein
LAKSRSLADEHLVGAEHDPARNRAGDAPCLHLGKRRGDVARRRIFGGQRLGRCDLVDCGRSDLDRDARRFEQPGADRGA